MRGKFPPFAARDRVQSLVRARLVVVAIEAGRFADQATTNKVSCEAQPKCRGNYQWPEARPERKRQPAARPHDPHRLPKPIFLPSPIHKRPAGSLQPPADL